MKNVDVPMWDKGDDTDSFSKGGGRSSFGFSDMKQNSESLKKIFKLVLGREPSSREISQYKYSGLKEEEIIEKLLQDDEHKGILEKVKEVPELKIKNRKYQSNILKLKSTIEDRENEFLELRRLLEEKNRLLEEFRSKNDTPVLTNREYIEEQNIHYSINKDAVKKDTKESFLDRLMYLIMGKK